MSICITYDIKKMLLVVLVFYLWKQQKSVENTYFLLSFPTSPDSNWVNSFPSAPPYSSQWKTLPTSILLLWLIEDSNELLGIEGITLKRGVGGDVAIARRYAMFEGII